MTEQLRAYLDEQMQAIDEDVRQAIELADGDVHRALRITLIANAFLQEENETLKAQVSKGYRRAK
jgi:ABC-type Fe3+/spermidine/putrescine transport system ATPase subunit